MSDIKERIEHLKANKKKYEDELGLVNKRLTELDDERNRVVRVGIRIEGALAYIASEMSELEQEAKKAAAAAEADRQQAAA